MKLCSVLVGIGAAAFAAACCGVGSGGAAVRFTGQTNIVIWDEAHGIEHFIRDARFETKGGSLGFIAPTPSKPELSAADGAAFHTLENLAPMPATKGDVAGAAAMDAGAVEVVAIQDVAGYRATILKATDGEGLKRWLNANGYPSPAFLPTWSKPYTERGWTFTAFKVSGKEAATGPLRMSFATKRPFNPYSVPEENGSDGVPLRVYYVSAGKEVPKIGGKAAWIKPAWSVDLPAETAGRLASQLKLSADAIPTNARVTTYQDDAFGRPGLDDLYFVRDDSLSNAVGGGAVAAVLLIAALRRRRRTTA